MMLKNTSQKKEINEDKQFHHAVIDFQDKMFGFMLKNSKQFRIPIPFKGQLGLFEVKLPRTSIKKNQLVSDIIDEEYRYQWIGHH